MLFDTLFSSNKLKLLSLQKRKDIEENLISCQDCECWLQSFFLFYLITQYSIKRITNLKSNSVEHCEYFIFSKIFKFQSFSRWHPLCEVNKWRYQANRNDRFGGTTKAVCMCSYVRFHHSSCSSLHSHLDLGKVRCQDKWIDHRLVGLLLEVHRLLVVQPKTS